MSDSNSAPLFEQIDLNKHGFLEASAGTGKTYTLENFILRLIRETEIKVQELLVMTFTEKATGELKARIRSSLYSAYLEQSEKGELELARRYKECWLAGDQLQIQTLHGFCQQVSNEFAFENQCAMEMELVDDSKIYKAVFHELFSRELVQTFGEQYSKLLKALDFTSRFEEDFGKLLKMYNESFLVLPKAQAGSDWHSQLRDLDMEDAAALSKFKAMFSSFLIESIQKKARELKLDKGYQSYDDMIYSLWKVIHDDPKGLLAKTLAQRFKFVMVDEFQDTDEMQWSILKSVFMQGYGMHYGNKVYVVGDPKQAIYRFRGGDLSTYLEARHYFQDHPADCQIYQMHQNWRSSSALVNSLNVLFDSQNTIPWFAPVSEVPEEVAGHRTYVEEEIEYTPVEAASKVCWVDSKDNEESIGFLHILDSKSGADFKEGYFEQTAIEVCKILNRKPQYHDKSGEKKSLKPGDICCLTRSNKEAILLERELKKRSVPVSIYKKSKLFESKESLHILLLLMLASDPGNVEYRKKALLTSFFGVKYSQEARLDQCDFGLEFEKLLASWKQALIRRQWARLFNAMISQTWLSKNLCSSESTQELGAALSVYQQIFDSLQREAIARNLDGMALIETLKALRSKDRDLPPELDTFAIGSQDSRVQIMTMHTSKGLEFPVVFVAGGFTKGNNTDTFRSGHVFEDGKVYRALSTNKDLDKAQKFEEACEERRLFYVAMTRASLKLYLPVTVHALEEGGYKPHSHHLALDKWMGPMLRSCFFRSSHGQTEASPDCLKSEFPTELILSDKEDRQIELNYVAQDLQEEGMEFEEGLIVNHEQIQISLQSFSKISRSLNRVQERAKGFVQSVESVGRDDEPGNLQRLRLEDSELPVAGADLGNVVHDSLEAMLLMNKQNHKDFEEKIATKDYNEVVEKFCGLYGIDAGFVPQISALIDRTLTSEFGLPDASGKLRFCDLSINSYQPEVPFTMIARPRGLILKGEQELLHKKLESFLRGSIDLLFEFEGKFYVLDWKTNWIETGYSQGKLLAKMQDSNYFLQARIYNMAFQLWAEKNVKDYSKNKDFGGVIYLYLRGLSKGEGFLHLPGNCFPHESVEQLRAQILDLVMNPQDYNGIEGLDDKAMHDKSLGSNNQDSEGSKRQNSIENNSESLLTKGSSEQRPVSGDSE